MIKDLTQKFNLSLKKLLKEFDTISNTERE